MFNAHLCLLKIVKHSLLSYVTSAVKGCTHLPSTLSLYLKARVTQRNEVPHLKWGSRRFESALGYTGCSSEVERRLWEADAAGSIPATPIAVLRQVHSLECD